MSEEPFSNAFWCAVVGYLLCVCIFICRMGVIQQFECIEYLQYFPILYALRVEGSNSGCGDAYG